MHLFSLINFMYTRKFHDATISTSALYLAHLTTQILVPLAFSHALFPSCSKHRQSFLSLYLTAQLLFLSPSA